MTSMRKACSQDQVTSTKIYSLEDITLSTGPSLYPLEEYDDFYERICYPSTSRMMAPSGYGADSD